MNIVLQRESSECGHASLVMILDYYGYIIDLETYRDKIIVSSEGTNFSEMMNIANKFGLDAEAYSVKQKDVDEIQVPAILQIQGDHFVVIEYIDKNYIHIIDPAVGKRKLSKLMLYEEIGFDQLCYVLEFNPNNDFIKGKYKKEITLFDIIRNISGINTYYFSFFFFVLILQCVIILTPIYVQVIMDNVIISNNKNLLTALLIGFSFIYIYDILTSYLKESMRIYLENRIIKTTSTQYFHKMIRLPIIFFENRSTAVLINKFEILQKVMKIISNITTIVFIDFLMILLLILAMFYINVKLSLIVLLVTSINLIFYYFHYNLNVKLLSEYWHKDGNLKSNMLSFFENIKTIKLFSIEQKSYRTYSKKLNDYMILDKKINNMNNIFSHFGKSITHIDTLIVIYLGALLVLDSEITIGMLYSFIFYKTVFTSSFISLIDKMMSIKTAQVDISYFKDVLLEKEEETDNKMKFLLPNINEELYSVLESIEFKNFSYIAEKSNFQVFNKINIKIDRNLSCCILGKSGSGKTTLLNSLVRLYNIEKNSIYINGVDITQIPLSYLRQNISYYNAGETFFDVSIIENIALDTHDVDIERIISILKGLDLFSYILNELPGGLMSYVGNIEHRFSTGQKQRLLLARAIYKNSNLMLLDEPTSALDELTEEKVMKYLMSLNKRMIVVTHRKSMVKYFKYVINMDTIV